jgi:hypothetical protein
VQPPRGTCPLLREEPRLQSPVLCGGSSLRFLRLDQLSEVSVTELGRTWNKEHSIAAQCDLERQSLFTVKFVRLRLIRHLLDGSDSQLRPVKSWTGSLPLQEWWSDTRCQSLCWVRLSRQHSGDKLVCKGGAHQSVAVNVLTPLLLRSLCIIHRQVLFAKDLDRKNVFALVLPDQPSDQKMKAVLTNSTLYRFSSCPTTVSACIR